MATRSTIAILNLDGSVNSIYCHNDGYLSNNGKILHLYYKDINKVKELISLGDMSSLKFEIHPPIGAIHNSNNRQENICVFYKRDAGETDVDFKSYNTLDEYISNGDFQEYDYIFNQKNNNWYLINLNTNKLKKLSTLLLNDKEVDDDCKNIILKERLVKNLDKILPKSSNQIIKSKL